MLLHNVSILLPLLKYSLNETENNIFELILHLIPPYTFGCAIRNYINVFLHNYYCKKYNTCDTDYRFEDPCCRELKYFIIYQSKKTFNNNNSNNNK